MEKILKKCFLDATIHFDNCWGGALSVDLVSFTHHQRPLPVRSTCNHIHIKGATTFSRTTLSILGFTANNKHNDAQNNDTRPNDTECRIFRAMPSVVMLSVIRPSVVMLIVVMQNVILLSIVIMPSV